MDKFIMTKFRLLERFGKREFEQRFDSTVFTTIDGITYRRAEILGCIDREVRPVLGDIVSSISIDRSTVSSLVQKMVDTGLVSKKTVDGRKRGVWLTEDGRDVVDSCRETAMEAEETILSRLPEELRKQFLLAVDILIGK